MRNQIVFFLSFLICSCAESEPPARSSHLSELYHADPKQDAAKAISEQDYQFIAVHNHKLIMPMNIDTCILDKFGYRVISNESLEYMSYDFQMYGAISVIYANWYNYEILSRLEELEEYPCKKET